MISSQEVLYRIEAINEAASFNLKLGLGVIYGLMMAANYPEEASTFYRDTLKGMAKDAPLEVIERELEEVVKVILGK
jgi:hypothetical protein